MLGLAAGSVLVGSGRALAQPAAPAVELAALELRRGDGVLELDFAARVRLPAAVQDALQRGVAVYFVAQAQLMRARWYWRDERVARVQRSWRVAYQPLTASWRVGFGGLNQTFPTLAEALAVVTRVSNWRLVELAQIDPDSRYYVDFSWRLDNSQLPSPMQIGLAAQGDWALGIERAVRLE
jgi:hypothetical protein